MEDKNLNIWQNYKDNVLMLLPFLDNVIVKAEGLYVVDANDKKIMDFVGGMFCSLLGHNHPKLVERLKKQLDITIHTGSVYLSTSFFNASSKLSGILPGNLDRVAFFSTGTEANEVAIKIAKEYTGRFGILGFDKGHLGSSYLMRQIGFFWRARPSCKPIIPNIYAIPTPTCQQCPVKKTYPECDFLCIKISERKLKRNLNKIATMIAEPVISEAGMVVPPPGYFKKLKEILEKYKILLTIDEAQTAFGRTGKWFAIENHDTVPDILVASKTIGSGYPVSMVATNTKIEEKLISEKFTCITSHMNDPLGAEAVSAVIDIIKEENLISNSAERGKYLFQSLNNLKNDFPQMISGINGAALMAGILINGFKDEKAEEIGLRLAYTLIENGLNINWFSTSVLILEPPIIISDLDIDKAIDILRKSIEEVLNDRSKNKGLFRKNERSSMLEKTMIEKKTFLEKAARRLFGK